MRFVFCPRKAFAWLLFVVASSVLSARATDSTNRLHYNHDIRPILSENCFVCHGPDKNNRKAKLRLDVREVALEKGAVVPGKPEQSELVNRIYNTNEDDEIGREH